LSEKVSVVKVSVLTLAALSSQFDS